MSDHPRRIECFLLTETEFIELCRLVARYTEQDTGRRSSDP